MLDANAARSSSGQTLDEAFQQAVAHHQAGRLQEAEQVYRAILRSQPIHADANHNLGVLAVQQGQAASGLRHFKVALEANPRQPQYWLSYIVALIESGNAGAARQALAEVQRLNLGSRELDALAERLAGDARNANQPGAEYPQGVGEESAPAASTAIEESHKETVAEFASLEGATRELTPAAQRQPSPQAINALVALFADGRYAEAAEFAQALTQRFPAHGFGWKALGAALGQTGRNGDALAPLQRAIALSPLDVEAHFNLGITLRELGRLNDAEASYRRALAIKPDYAEAHNHLGLALKDMRRLNESESCFREALRLKPDFALALFNLGSALVDLDRLNEAEISFRSALALEQNFAPALCNLGVTLSRLGRIEEAEACYRQALSIQPDYAEAHDNLGITLQQLGRLHEAEASYRQALKINPGFVDALNNLALLLNARNRPDLALHTIQQSLRSAETQEAKSIFVACAKRLRVVQGDSDLRATMVRALTEPWGRPSELAGLGVDLVKLNAPIGKCVSRAAQAWPRRLSAQALFGSSGLAAAAEDPLLCALLESTPICDAAMERFLTMARHAMLDAAMAIPDAGGDIEAHSKFFSALARQCFINEYVYIRTDIEMEIARDLLDSLQQALAANARIAAIWPLAAAAYFPLHSLHFARRLLDRQWAQDVMAVLTQQIREPEEEREQRARIPRLTDIEDKVSRRVQTQYEENPYPRWVKVAPALAAKDFLRQLSQRVPTAAVSKHASGGIDVLIAGCGTGLHAIDAAQRFPGSRILAVDLSVSSLGYALRKTKELGLTSISYAQADLLKLDSLGRSFDIIESSGVLHHLADPLAGWRVLLSLLRPSGFMRLGLYSKIARRNIAKARAYIAERGYGTSADEIRRCRQDLMDLDETVEFKTEFKSPDFFSTSNCRDLLFHVQEHSLTLPDIDGFIRANKLAFLGFDIEASVLQAYKARFPEDRRATRLDIWQIFENENPETFAGMYQFWIQKID